MTPLQLSLYPANPSPANTSESHADAGVQIALETETTNTPSLRIYEKLGFLRTKKLHRYYLNGNPAFRLVLYLKDGVAYRPTWPPEMAAEGDGWDAESAARANCEEDGEEEALVRQVGDLRV